MNSCSKVRITYISIGVNIVLTTIKLIIACITGSSSILSESAHSASDLITSFIALFSVREAEKPADRDHPYGHGKFENIGSLFEALIIFTSGILVSYKAIRSIILKSHIVDLDLGIGVMLFSAVVNFFMSSYLIKKGRELNSPVIEADGWHSRTDVFTALGVFVALILIKFTHITIIDPIVALVVATVIFSIAIKIGLRSFNVLVDTSLPSTVEEKIKEILDKYKGEYIEVHSFRTRSSGQDFYIDMHMVFADSTPLKKAHLLTEKIEREIESVLPHSKTLIHIEPCDSGKQLKNRVCRKKTCLSEEDFLSEND